MQGTFVVEPKDLSSTEPYQRDNLAHFFMCVPCLHTVQCPVSGSHCSYAASYFTMWQTTHQAAIAPETLGT